MLIQPNPDLQFVVEVDASDSGVGAILSQCLPADKKLHICALFSYRLTPAEKNWWGTENSWQWSWHFGNGGTGWREPNTHLLYGQTIKTCLTFAQLTG